MCPPASTLSGAVFSSQWHIAITEMLCSAAGAVLLDRARIRHRIGGYCAGGIAIPLSA
jgi:hypothetical protein